MKNEEQLILQRHLSRFLVKETFNCIEAEDILRDWKFKGEELSPAQINTLKSQAKTFKESVLWKVLKNELLWQGQQAGFVKSKTEADMIAGKLLIFMMNEIDAKLDSIVKN
jgi:hypothetical protein